MKKIDIDWIRRIDAIHDKLDRHTPNGSKSSRCTKEILIDRYFKFLNGKAFKLRLPVSDTKYINDDDYETFYALFSKTKHTRVSSSNDEVCYSYGVRKHLGHNDSEFDISFIDEKINQRTFKLHLNGIFRIKYEEITVEKYWEIAKLFIDTDPPEPKSPNFNNCVDFDLAQGRYHCASNNVPNKKCVGVDCGFYNDKYSDAARL